MDKRPDRLWTTAIPGRRGRTVDHMPGDPSLTDEAMQSEIELVEALVLAASETEGPMTQESIDEALGVPPTDEPAAGDDTL